MLKKIAACMIVFLPTLLGAQTSDFGSWCDVQVIKSLGKAYAMARLEHRSCESLSKTECALAMAGAGYRFTPWLKGDLSYEFWKIPASGDATIHKAVGSLSATLKKEELSVSLREKYELSFNAATAPAGTLRSRLSVNWTPKSGPFRPYLMYEFFNGLSGEGWIRSLHYAGTEIKISANHSIDVFYLLHLHPASSSASGTSTVRCDHILGLGYCLYLF